MPLFAIEHLPMQGISTENYDAVLLTSGNAARAAAGFLTNRHNLPIYAVGSATANALQKLSVLVARTGAEGVEVLAGVAMADGHTRLLWLAGEDHSAIPHIQGVSIDIEIVYRSAAVLVPEDFATKVLQCDTIILHSSRAAAHFAELCSAEGIPRDEIALATFSNGIAESAGEGWASMIVANAPNDAALLNSIEEHYSPNRVNACDVLIEGST